MAATLEVPTGRPPAALRRALRLEYVTVAWNIVEGVVAVSAALVAGSVALLGFGIDSFVESASAGVLIWRLRSERRGLDHDALERVEQRAQKLVAASLFGLAIYIAADATLTLWRGDRPDPSVVGMVVTGVSLGTMWWLARAKHQTARAVGSRAMEADAFQTTACFWLSAMALAGVSLNSFLGWWWADPVAAGGIAIFLAREARSVWRGDECCEF